MACLEVILSNPDRKPVDLLTKKEYEVLGLVALGLPDDSIAQHCNISQKSVTVLLHNIFKKINAPDRLQAMLWAGKNL